MNKAINVPDPAGFCAAFGDVGLKVGPRTGENKRTQDDKEWYVVRRFLREGMLRRVFKTPFSIEKAHPPKPDFALDFNDGNATAFLEITEATRPADQREMTEIGRSNQATLLGEFGGRFSDGASQPGLAWASDVVDAIERKVGKAIYSPSEANRHLVIYPNSNASFLLFDARDECAAFSFLAELIARERHRCVDMASGCFVHVLGKWWVCFDLLGESRLVRRIRKK